MKMVEIVKVFVSFQNIYNINMNLTWDIKWNVVLTFCLDDDKISLSPVFYKIFETFISASFFLMKSLFSVTFTIMWFIILVLKYILLCFALLFHFFILKLSHRDKVVWASQPGLDGWYLGSKNISSSFEISRDEENIFSFRENLA